MGAAGAVVTAPPTGVRHFPLGQSGPTGNPFRLAGCRASLDKNLTRRHDVVYSSQNLGQTDFPLENTGHSKIIRSIGLYSPEGGILG